MRTVLDFGAVAGGADCTAAFQKALDWSSANGEAVQVPVAMFHFTDPRGLVADHNAGLVGQRPGPFDPLYCPWERLTGATLLVRQRAATQGKPFFTGQGGNVSLESLIIAYPDQIRATQAGAPTAYPPTIVMKQTGHLSRLYVPNAYEALKFYSGRVDMEWCGIQGLKQDLEIDGSWDVNSISHCRFHWYCGWGSSPFGLPLFWWTLENSRGLRFVKADGLQLDNLLIFGRHTAITFDADESAEGSWATSGSASDVNIDTCRNGVIVRGLEPRVGFNFTNLQLGPYWGHPLGVAIQTFPSVKNKPIVTVRGGSIRRATDPLRDWPIITGAWTKLDIEGMLGHGRLGPQL